MKSKIYLFMVMVLAYGSNLYAFETSHPHTIIMALEIQEELKIYKDKSEQLEARLVDVYKELIQSEYDKDELSSDIESLVKSLATSTQKFEAALDIIKSYEIQVQEQKKSLDSREDIFFVLFVVVVTRMVLVVIGWILAWRKIQLPFWLDILF